MGAFNEWTRGTPLAQPENRLAVLVAQNLLYGCALQLRRQFLRAQGIQLRVGPAGGSTAEVAPLDPPALRTIFHC